ncbi:hypothetical protein [Aquibacillus saliphilus]|nr:hypothetical protein [Aquibacillus saliphilus]
MKLKKNDQKIEEFTVAVAEGKTTLSDIVGWLETNTEEYSK